MLGTSVTGTNQRSRGSTDRSAAAASPPVYTIGSSASERDRLRSQTDELHEHSVALLERVGIQPGGSARASMRTARRPRAARQARRANGHGNGIGHQPGPRRAGTPARDLTGPWQCERDRGRRPPVRAARRIIRPRLRTAHPHQRARPRTSRRGDGPPRQARRLDRMRRGRRRRDDLPTTAPRIHPPDQHFQDALPPRRRRHSHRPALHQLLDAAGVVDIGVQARADVPPAGHPRRTVILDILRAMRTKITEQGLLSTAELDRLDSDARKHLADPSTLIMPHLSFIAWGRKPDHPSRITPIGETMQHPSGAPDLVRNSQPRSRRPGTNARPPLRLVARKRPRFATHCRCGRISPALNDSPMPTCA